ncbi:MAG TPA: hypothetical protein VGO47_13590, partial [Chlamydiales bacterium]|nr:hypothetical protein [Chlamydiales bacterium]
TRLNFNDILFFQNMADIKSLTSHIRKLDGNNWDTWRTNIIAGLMYGDSWGIANGTEPAPKPIVVPARDGVPATADKPEIPATAEHNANQSAIDDWNKRNRQGLSVVVLSCTEAIQQRLELSKSLKENWDLLEAAYGTTTGLTLWVDFQKFTRSEFSVSSSLSEQLDDLTNIST